MNFEIKIIDKEFYKNRELPGFATEGSAATDIICTKSVSIGPGDTKMIDTGLAIHIGSHNIQHQVYGSPRFSYTALILPRSGLGHQGLVLGNTIGVIDEDYQGELKVSAWNRTATSTIYLTAGARFAQIMFIPIIKPFFRVVGEFSKTTGRGNGGFGSTGK